MKLLLVLTLIASALAFTLEEGKNDLKAIKQVYDLANKNLLSKTFDPARFYWIVLPVVRLSGYRTEEAFKHLPNVNVPVNDQPMDQSYCKELANIFGEVASAGNEFYDLFMKPAFTCNEKTKKDNADKEQRLPTRLRDSVRFFKRYHARFLDNCNQEPLPGFRDNYSSISNRIAFAIQAFDDLEAYCKKM